MAVENGRPGMNFTEAGFQGISGLKGFHFRQDKEIGPQEVIKGFSQDTPREQVTVTKPDRRIDEDDVQVPVKPEVLKPVVQEEPPDAKLVKRESSRGGTVRSDKDGGLFQSFCHQERFVSPLCGSEKDLVSVRDDRPAPVFPFIAPAQDSDGDPPFPQGRRKGHDKRGLSGSSDRDIPHADDRGRKPDRPQNMVGV